MPSTDAFNWQCYQNKQACLFLCCMIVCVFASFVCSFVYQLTYLTGVTRDPLRSWSALVVSNGHFGQLAQTDHHWLLDIGEPGFHVTSRLETLTPSTKTTTKMKILTNGFVLISLVPPCTLEWEFHLKKLLKVFTEVTLLSFLKVQRTQN